MTKFLIIFFSVGIFSIAQQLQIPISGNLFYDQQEQTLKSSPEFNKNFRIMHDTIPTWSAKNRSWAILTDPDNNRYKHGILGDSIEATSITITDEYGKNKFKIELPYPEVFETRYAIWADANGDGQEELTATVSDNINGASVRIYSGTNGKEIARGALIGNRNRWLHMIGWAPFTGSTPILALVKTPHIGGVLEFYAIQDDHLVKVTEKRGFSTHKIGSKNLHMVAAIDNDNDGIVELYLPNIRHNKIIGVTVNSGEIKDFVSYRINKSFDTPIYILKKKYGYWIKFGIQEEKLK